VRHVAAVLCVALATAPTTARAQGAGGGDRLGAVVRWAAPDADGYRDGYIVSLPPALDSTIHFVLPTFRVRTRTEMTYGSFDPERPQASMSAVVVDLDGDRLPEAVLLGTLTDEDTLDVVLGVRQTGRGFEVRELFRAHAPLMPGDGGSPDVDTNVLALDRLTASDTTSWVRYQNVDCKGEGWRWTVRAGRWVRTASPCRYGD
jgi:hypothetical protein